ncbi:unnamed protein product [Calicophoron daubneyi]|uniref:DNA polymerase epsilon subunit 3 n=1 Tax=Calicophoron daubneyi TaxID=300641 RepID=A0AAV2TCJ5_CALDB
MAENSDELYLPNAVILRIIKDSLPDRMLVSREARSAISKSASSFILYVTSLASTHCEAAKRKTLQVSDILAALKEMQFGHYVSTLEKFMDEYRAKNIQKKAAKSSSSAVSSEEGSTSGGQMTADIKVDPASESDPVDLTLDDETEEETKDDEEHSEVEISSDSAESTEAKDLDGNEDASSTDATEALQQSPNPLDA